MKDLIACCGLNCEKCDARIATLNDDNQLREKTAKLWSKLNNTEITPEMINCEGCRVGKVHTPFCDSYCEIKKCVQEKNYATCAECSDMDTCQVLGMIAKSTPEVIQNLKNK